jgi:Zn-dependent protease
MLGTDPVIFVIRAITLVIAFTFHEFSHAWVATRFGDNTPRAYGRLTLNPLRHLDPLGSLLLLVAGFGWAKPVPINPYNMRSPSGVMWTSLAGPFSNFLLAIIAAIPLRLGLSFDQSNLFGYFLINFMEINLLLMLFNLIPIAPLDGEKIALYVWPPSWSGVLEKISRFGPIALLVVIFLLPYLLRVDLLGSVMVGPLNNLALLLLGRAPILF